MLLAEEIMSARRRGRLNARVRQRISKGIRKALRGSGLRNRTKMMRRTLRRPRTQASRLRSRIRKQRKYDRHQKKTRKTMRRRASSETLNNLELRVSALEARTASLASNRNVLMVSSILREEGRANGSYGWNLESDYN